MEKSPEQIVREQLEAGPARNWDWSTDGEVFVGTIVGAFQANTKFRENCPVLVCRTESGEVVNLWLSNGVLEKKVLETNPQYGDTYGIQRLELETSKTGNEYRNWNVIPYKAAGGPLFLGASAGAAQALPPGEGAPLQYGEAAQGVEVPSDDGDIYQPDPNTWRQ